MEESLSREEKRKRQKKDRKKRLRKEAALTQLEAAKTVVQKEHPSESEESEENRTQNAMESKSTPRFMTSICEQCKESKVRYYCQDCNRCYCEKVCLPRPFQCSAMMKSIGNSRPTTCSM